MGPMPSRGRAVGGGPAALGTEVSERQECGLTPTARPGDAMNATAKRVYLALLLALSLWPDRWDGDGDAGA